MAETVALGIGMFFVSLPRQVQLPLSLSLALQLKSSVLQRTGDDKARMRKNNHCRLEGRAEKESVLAEKECCVLVSPARTALEGQLLSKISFIALLC